MLLEVSVGIEERRIRKLLNFRVAEQAQLITCQQDQGKGRRGKEALKGIKH